MLPSSSYGTNTSTHEYKRFLCCMSMLQARSPTVHLHNQLPTSLSIQTVHVMIRTPVITYIQLILSSKKIATKNLFDYTHMSGSHLSCWKKFLPAQLHSLKSHSEYQMSGYASSLVAENDIHQSSCPTLVCQGHIFPTGNPVKSHDLFSVH
jgi:hypothetical protein